MFIAGPASYWVTVEQPTSRLEDVMITSIMADSAQPPVVLPRSVQIRYIAAGTRSGVTYSGIPATLRWSQDNAHYNLHWEFLSSMAGNRRRSNHGVLTPQGLAPAILMDMDDERREQWRFDYANKQLVGAVDQARLEFTPGTQDELSVVIQLAAVAAAQPKELTPGAKLSVPVLEANQVHDTSFTVAGEELIMALEDKALPTIHLIHQAEGEAQSAVEVWLAPSLDYMPARWRITHANGDTQDRLAQKAIGLETAPPQTEAR